MPILIFALGIPTTIAIGTDLFQVVITGSVGSLLYALSNHVDLLMAVIMLSAASMGSQLGVTATRYVDGGRIRFLYGITVLSGCAAVALKQASVSIDNVGFLSTIGSIILFGVAGAICGVIIAMLVATRLRSTEPVPLKSSGSDPHT